jgi:quinol monooxygenase YgiN
MRLKPAATGGLPAGRTLNSRRNPSIGVKLRKEKTMERREFLAALGTAVTVSSASQVLAQTGGGSPQKVNVALYVTLEAKPGKEEAVAEFLRQGKALAEAEPATIAWFGIRLGPSTFAIFDAFPDEAGRHAHLAGKVAAALMANAPDLLAQPPSIQKADVLASKLPG